MNELTRFDPNERSAREVVDIEVLRAARAAGWLVEDPERRRARYFDGRFLTAADLTRDQQYFGSRQLDLGRMGGLGVVHGLELRAGATAAELVVTAGHGITPGGDQVVLLEDIAVDLTDLPALQALDAIFGLEVRPDTPLRNRTGLFVIALRNVEYTAKPVATYPSDLQQQRRIEDGEIIEATAVTLVPFETLSPGDSTEQGRARLAREIFLREAGPRLPDEALPVGAVALERGLVRWVDPYLVRRDASTDDSLGFGMAPRAVREAFLRQYEQHLDDVLAARSAAGQTGAFAAAEHFQALPAFGRIPLPSLQIIGDQIVQSYFPAEVGVELTIVPDDELAALQEEAIASPPLDLRAPSAVLQECSVLVLVPVPRADYGSFVARLEGKLSRHPRPRLVRTRGSLFDELTRARLLERRAPPVPVAVDLLPWQDALLALGARGSSPLFVRRRRLPQVVFAFSRFQAFPPDSPNPSETLSQEVRERLTDAGELTPDDGDPTTPTSTSRFDFLMRRTTNDVLVAVEGLLRGPQFAVAAPFAERVLVQGVVAELAYRTRVRLEELSVSTEARRSVIDVGDGVVAAEASAPVRVRALRREDVDKVAERYARAGVDSGWDLLVTAQPELLRPERRQVLADSFRVPELGVRAQRLSRISSTEFAELAAELLVAAQTGDVGAVRDLVDLQFIPPDLEEFPEIPGFPGSRVARDLGEGRLYHIIHGAAAGEPALQERISELLSRTSHDQPMIVSTLLANLLVEALSLQLFSQPQLERVESVLEALSAWDLGDPPFSVPGNGNSTPVLSSENVDVTNLLDAYAALELEPRLGLLTEVLNDHGWTGGLDEYRTIGFAGQPARLILRVLRADAEQIGPLVVAINEALAHRAQGLTRLLQLALG